MRRSWLGLTALILLVTLALMLLRFMLAPLIPAPIVAYMTLETGLPVVIVQDLNHRLKKRLDFDYFTDPSFSPDRARLALPSSLNFGSDIVTYDLRTSQLRRLTASVAIAESPAGSPDGPFIA